MRFPVGIDIGNSKCVVATSNNGVVDALLNEDFTRETPTVVHFATNRRLFGAAGANHASSDPSSTISQLKRLVGLQNNSHEERLRLPYETSTDADGGVSVEVRYLGEDHAFTAVEMMVMLLSHLRQTAEMTVGSAVSYCIIGVPSYFTSQKKRAYLDAARVAGWNPLKLLHDGTATALEYRSKMKGPPDAAVVVAFVDVGHCDTQVTVVRFQGRKMRVIAEACDRYLGGGDFDEVLFQYVVDEFRKKLGIDVCSDLKATVKLRTACEKAKRVLSEKKEAQLRVDSLMGGIDVSWAIMRKEFERLSSGLLDRIGEVFCEALQKANLLAGGVHSVELAGSGSRIPAISRKLTEVFGREVSRTLEGSECVAFGCALQCEKMLSGMFREDNGHEKRHGRVTSRLGTSSIEFIAVGNRKNALLKAKGKEEKLAQQDKIVERAKERRNSLEAYICKSHSKLKTKEITNESERDKISTKLALMEEWLFVEGADQPENVYEDKLLELKSLVSPIGHHGEETQVKLSKGPQTGITVSPVPGRSPPSYTGEVSTECSSAQLSDWISPSMDEICSQSEIEANILCMNNSLPLTREQRQGGSSLRDTGSVVLEKNRHKSLRRRICSICQLCRETDAKSPSHR